MKPLSIHSRLLIAALVTTLIALTATGWILKNEITHVISENLSAKLDAQVGMIERGVGVDGRPRPDRMQYVADLDRADTDWGWRLQTSAGHWAGGAIYGPTRLWAGFPEERAGAVNALAERRDGTPLYVRIRRRVTGTVEVAVPMEMLNVTLRPAMNKMLAALAGMAVVLIGATLVQLRFGLEPLRALRSDLARVRSGDAEAVADAQPRELVPLAQEVNALVAQNAAGLAHARTHVSNLAHGLKTPLATLALTLGREGEEARTKARAIVADLDRRIDHHLARARVAAAGAGGRARADVAAVAAVLLPAMRQLYAGKGIVIASTLDPMSLSVDRHDLDEMLGNLLDNACRHAPGFVRICSMREGDEARLIVEDDGLGINDDSLDTATRAGVRLDESGRGYGFGLAIVEDLSGFYGGKLLLDRSPDLGGLRATLVLPVR